jgi:hypothetical protein
MDECARYFIIANHPTHHQLPVVDSVHTHTSTNKNGNMILGGGLLSNSKKFVKPLRKREIERS